MGGLKVIGVTVVAAALGAAAPAARAVTWTPVETGVSSTISGIDYQSSGLHLATSGGQLLSRQADGSFSKFTAAAGTSFLDIAFQPGGNIGIAVGTNGAVYRTTNGGANWGAVTGLQGANTDCTALEPVTENIYAVRWAAGPADGSAQEVYAFAKSRKVLRSTNAGGSWTEVNRKSAGGCKAMYGLSNGVGVSDGYFLPGGSGWTMGANFGEVFLAASVTTDDSWKLLGSGPNGFDKPKRLAVDPNETNRQWAIGIDEEANGSYLQRTTDSWGSKDSWRFAAQPTRPARTAALDVATAGGTVIEVGYAGQIEVSTDGVTFFYAPATGALAGKDWNAVDVADAQNAAVGGNDGKLALASDANVLPDVEKPTGTITEPKPVQAGVPATFVLNGADTGGSGFNPASVTWSSSGLAAPATGQTVQLTFPREGFYTLRATFSDNAGNTGEATAYVDVDKPLVSFNFGSSSKPFGTPKSERRNGKRYTVINVRGKLGYPAGVSRSAACKGKVTITITNKKRHVTTRKAKVSSKTCKFRKKVRFRRSKIRGRKITVTLEFPGNTVVARSTYRKSMTLRK